VESLTKTVGQFPSEKYLFSVPKLTRYIYIYIYINCVEKYSVYVGNGTQSNTTISLKVYLMAILDNYMFRPILAIFRLS